MGKSYLAYLQEERRLMVLRVLAEMPLYSSNTSSLFAALNRFGHGVTRDEVRSLVAWLHEQLLVQAEPVDGVDGLLVVQLTERGGDTAAGRAIVPGVQKPSPR